MEWLIYSSLFQDECTYINILEVYTYIVVPFKWITHSWIFVYYLLMNICGIFVREYILMDKSSLDICLLLVNEYLWNTRPWIYYKWITRPWIFVYYLLTNVCRILVLGYLWTTRFWIFVDYLFFDIHGLQLLMDIRGLFVLEYLKTTRPWIFVNYSFFDICELLANAYS